MVDKNYSIKISPGVINGDIFKVNYNGVTITGTSYVKECCVLRPKTIEIKVTGSTYAYTAMTEVLSGGTYNTGTTQYDSLLTGLTVPILLTENTVDVGYYSVFDGMVLQKDTMLNFLFSSTTLDQYGVYFYNTSDIEYKKYLQFSTYEVDWGDGNKEPVTSTLPIYHPYSSPGSFKITMSGMSPWGTNIITKTVNVPFTGTTILNPNGEAFFTPMGGNWKNILVPYTYIFSGDSNCDSTTEDIKLFNQPQSIPFLITGYTTSSLTDLKQYGPIPYYTTDYYITGNTGSIGKYLGIGDNGLYTAYTINDITYYDYNDGTTVFIAESSGLTTDVVICQPIVKNELLLGIIDEAEVQSNVFIERGKNSALESIERLGEVNNIGSLEKYGYKFFNIINATT
jgi:hypothetical protein